MQTNFTVLWQKLRHLHLHRFTKFGETAKFI